MTASLATSDMPAPPRAEARPAVRVLLVADPSRVWRWQTWLAAALAAKGDAVAFAFAEPGHSMPQSVGLLMTLERMLFAAPAGRASDLLDAAEVKTLPVADDSDRYDVAIDFTGEAQDLNATRVLRPTFDGVTGESGAIAALLDRQGPRLGLAEDGAGAEDFGRCALEHPDIFSRGLDGVFSRMAGLLLAAVHAPGTARGPAAAPKPKRRPDSPAAFLVASIAHKANAKLMRLLGQAPRWFVAWRRGGASAHDTLEIPWQDFTRLPDQGLRYYADPFVLMRGDTAHVFIEEVPFATGKGVISHFTIDAVGNASAPRPVLERPYHLSYPFVFERDGAVWMIPESSGNRTVELYRAERFPDRWVKEAVLIEDIVADDATLVEHGGRLWLFAGIRDWQASSWEALGLFSAETLTGPWQPHPHNPVLLDPRAARPAGALFRHQGKLIRPAQDCGRFYGDGLAFCRIDRLDETGFAQSVLTRVMPGAGGIKGLHTYNAAAGVEVIDIYGTPKG